MPLPVVHSPSPRQPAQDMSGDMAEVARGAPREGGDVSPGAAAAPGAAPAAPGLTEKVAEMAAELEEAKAARSRLVAEAQEIRIRITGHRETCREAEAGIAEDTKHRLTMEQAVDVQNAKVAKLDQDIVEAAQRLDVARAELAEQSQQHKGLERKAAVAARQGAVEIQEAAAARAAAQVTHHKKVAGLVQKVHAEEAARACAIQDYAKERSRLQETVREKEAEVAEAQKRIGDKHSAECVSAEKAVAELREEHLAELAKGDDYTRQRNEIQKQRLELDKKNCETLTQIAELRRTQDDTAAAQHTRLLELHQQARNLTCPDVVKAEADAVAALRSKKAALEREKQLLEVQTHGVALGRELQAKSAVEKAAKSASSARNAAHKKCEATFTREDKTRKQLEKLTEAHTAVEAEVAQQRTALEGLLQERDRLHAKRILEDDGEMSVIKRARN